MSGSAALGALGPALLARAAVRGAGPHGRLPRLALFLAETGSLTEPEKRGLWLLAQATGAVWSLSELSESDLRGFLDLKTRSAPSYLAEYRNALEIFAAAERDHTPTEAVQAILRGSTGGIAAAHARHFVIAEFLALYLASGAFRQFGLTRYRGFLGEGFRASAIQPGKPR
jgi:hypothetical protein